MAVVTPRPVALAWGGTRVRAYSPVWYVRLDAREVNTVSIRTRIGIVRAVAIIAASRTVLRACTRVLTTFCIALPVTTSPQPNVYRRRDATRIPETIPVKLEPTIDFSQRAEWMQAIPVNTVAHKQHIEHRTHRYLVPPEWAITQILFAIKNHLQDARPSVRTRDQISDAT